MTEKYNKLLEETQNKVNEYFVLCDSLNGNDGKKPVKPYTLSGLLCYLNLTRAEFEKLSHKKRYGEIFNGALAKIEAFTEEKALVGDLSANAAANTLKYNFGWNDTRQNDKDSSGVLKIVLDRELMSLAE